MTSKTQISCTVNQPHSNRCHGGQWCYSRNPVPAEQRSLSTSSTLEKKNNGTMVLRSLRLFFRIPWRAVNVSVSRVWRRRGRIRCTGGYPCRCELPWTLTAVRDYFFVGLFVSSCSPPLTAFAVFRAVYLKNAGATAWDFTKCAHWRQYVFALKGQNFDQWTKEAHITHI